MSIESGRIKLFIDPCHYPPKATIVKDNVKFELNHSDLIHVRACVNKAIKRAELMAPTDEEKLEIAKEREHLQRLRSLKPYYPRAQINRG